jgi:hypothetical protein
VRWPGRHLTLRRVEPESGSEIYLLGYDRPLEWSYDAAVGLTITLPDVLQDAGARPGTYAYAFRISGSPVEGVSGS